MVAFLKKEEVYPYIISASQSLKKTINKETNERKRKKTERKRQGEKKDVILHSGLAVR